MVEHADISDAYLHETKGAAGASADQILIANGDGTATFQDPPFSVMGWWDYNDLATASTPIQLTPADTDVELTNDGLGANTVTTYAYPSGSDIWDTDNSRIDFSNLNVGDTFDIRFDVIITTSTTNVTTQLFLEFDPDGTPFQVPLTSQIEHDVAADHPEVGWRGFYIGSEQVASGGCRIVAQSDNANTTVTVNGWYIRVVANV